MARTPIPIEQRFWSKVEIVGPEDCWIWRGSRFSNGYGEIGQGARRKLLAHRVAWTLTNGPIPMKLLVLHHCDNPPCVNPKHLFLGNQTDNLKDMKEKGRANHISPRGEQHAHKLTWDQVSEIRRTYFEGGITQEKLAARYNVGQICISNIMTNRTWKTS